MATDILYWFLEQFEKDPKQGHTVLEAARAMDSDVENTRKQITSHFLRGNLCMCPQRTKTKAKFYRLSPSVANTVRRHYGMPMSMHGI